MLHELGTTPNPAHLGRKLGPIPDRRDRHRALLWPNRHTSLDSLPTPPQIACVSAEANARARNQYAKRQSAGLCGRCQRVNDTHKKLCAYCREKLKLAKRRRVRRASRKYNRKQIIALPTARYIECEQELDALLPFGLMVMPLSLAPSIRWFYLRAKANHFVIATHTIEDRFVILRLK